MTTRIFLLNLSLLMAFGLAGAARSEAAVTEQEKCASKSHLVKGRFQSCLARGDANVAKGKDMDTVASDAKCESKFVTTWNRTRAKSQSKDSSLGSDCGGAMSDAVRDAIVAEALPDPIVDRWSLEASPGAAIFRADGTAILEFPRGLNCTWENEYRWGDVSTAQETLYRICWTRFWDDPNCIVWKASFTEDPKTVSLQRQDNPSGVVFVWNQDDSVNMTSNDQWVADYATADLSGCPAPSPSGAMVDGPILY